ncbi:MAG: HEAT repeat domain-containing protein [Dehalococcoidia bacterium]
MSLETLLAKLPESDYKPSTKELVGLSAIEGADQRRFLEVWRALSIQRRRDLIDRLVDLAEDSVEYDFNNVFMAGLLDDDVQVRTQSIKALWEYEEADLARVLLRLLKDPEAMVRAEAALGLGRYLLRAEILDKDLDVIPEIEEALRSVARDDLELTEVRGRAIEAIGVRAHEWVHDLIEDAYASGERRLQISAVHAMGRSADPDWLPTIVEEMHNEDAEMRFEAAQAAGELGEDDIIPDLASLTQDEDAEVQEAAIAALGHVGGPAARSVLLSVASESNDERVLESVTDALSEADFVEDPLGVKLYLDRSVAEDREEDDDE